MRSPIETWLDTHTRPNPGTVVPLQRLWHSYLAELPKPERDAWPKWRVIAALARLGYELAGDGRGQIHVVGVTLIDTAPDFKVNAGKLETVA